MDPFHVVLHIVVSCNKVRYSVHSFMFMRNLITFQSHSSTQTTQASILAQMIGLQRSLIQSGHKFSLYYLFVQAVCQSLSLLSRIGHRISRKRSRKDSAVALQITCPIHQHTKKGVNLMVSHMNLRLQAKLHLFKSRLHKLFSTSFQIQLTPVYKNIKYC